MNLNEVEIFEMANFFKNISDETRLKILLKLEKKEIKVNDLSESLGMTKSAISHQLSRLKMTRLVKARKQGKEVYYSLNDKHVQMIIGTTIEHLAHKDGECE